MTRNAQILATGSYVPERVVSNAEIDRLMGAETADWLVANVGIRERRWMAASTTLSRPHWPSVLRDWIRVSLKTSTRACRHLRDSQIS